MQYKQVRTGANLVLGMTSVRSDCLCSYMLDRLNIHQQGMSEVYIGCLHVEAQQK